MTVFRCEDCGKTFPFRPVYCHCGGANFHSDEVSGKGRIYSCTMLHAAAQPFEKDLPFQIAIVELEDGIRLTARITGPTVAIGDAVKLVDQQNGVHYFSAI